MPKLQIKSRQQLLPDNKVRAPRRGGGGSEILVSLVALPHKKKKRKGDNLICLKDSKGTFQPNELGVVSVESDRLGGLEHRPGEEVKEGLAALEIAIAPCP